MISVVIWSYIENKINFTFKGGTPPQMVGETLVLMSNENVIFSFIIIHCLNDTLVC